MTTPQTPDKSSRAASGSTLTTLLWGIVKILLVALIIGGALAAYKYQIATGPKAQRKKPKRAARLVHVIPLHKERCATVVKAMGPVVPARHVTLQPQVSGKIVEISEALIPGGIVHTGDKLIGIDPRDYEVVVRQRKGSLAQAQKDLKVEQGNQAVAKQEYELLGEVVSEEDKELVLRKPQLASAQAALDSAEAALRKAQLDLNRCDVNVPFNAIIQDKLVDLGATVSSNASLATLVGTDEAWIELKVATYQLQWLTIPQRNGQTGSKVKIFNKLAWGPDRFRTGRVVRLYGELESDGKLAQVLVAVDDPFCLKPENRDKPKLLIGSWVDARIEGRTLDDVVPIEWPHLRNNNTAIWIMNDADQLEIRPVEIVFDGPDSVFIRDGLTEGERLVVTDIAAPVEGMPLRIAEPEDPSTERETPTPTDEGEQS